MKVLLLLLGLIFSANCASLRTQNGTIARPGQWPFLVFLQQEYLTSPGNFEYGVGTLISDQYVLTSFLAFITAQGQITAFLGADNWKVQEEGQLRFDILQGDFIYTEPFDPARDLALIKLPEPVEFSAKIQPIQLPRWSDVDLDYSKKYALVAGWGPRSSAEEDDEPMSRPSYTEVQVLPKEECEIFPDSVICIAQKASSVYEEGSPVFIYNRDGYHQIALEAGYGYVTTGGKPIDIYIRLNKNLQWIVDNSNVEIQP